MQYIRRSGDFLLELNPRAGDGNFAYTLRKHGVQAEYSYASGGAINFLPSWFMITDNEDGNPLPEDGHISPDFIDLQALSLIDSTRVSQDILLLLVSTL